MPDCSLQELPISVRAYARRRGVSHTAVQRAISDGRLVRALERRAGYSPRVVASVADIEWAQRTNPAHSRAASSRGDSHDRLDAADEYRKSLALERIVKTRLAQTALEEKQGRLVDIDIVRRTFFDLVRAHRNQLQELPDRLADEIALERDAGRVRAILMRELTDVLQKLADRCRHEGMKEVQAIVDAEVPTGAALR